LAPPAWFTFARWTAGGRRIQAVTSDFRLITLDGTTGARLSEEPLPLDDPGPYDTLVGAAFDASGQTQAYSVARRRSSLYAMTNVR